MPPVIEPPERRSEIEGVRGVPVPMPLDRLLQYRWRTPLEVNSLKPVNIHATVGQAPVEPGSGPCPAPPKAIYMFMGLTSKPHVFATAPGPGLPALAHTVWGYGLDPALIQYPGPTLLAQCNATTRVRWVNCFPPNAGGTALGLRHPFVQPRGDAAATMPMRRYRVGTTAVHLHGGHMPWDSDGYPMRHPDFLAAPAQNSVLQPPLGAAHSAVTFTYPNTQPAGASLWYHDHAMDMTATNVYAGLAGGYLIVSAAEAASTVLPDADHHIPLIIQDRSFTDSGCLLYGDANYLATRRAQVGQTAQESRQGWGSPSPEFKGQAFVVNGKLWPYLEVDRCAYRFRIYNGCNSRVLALRVSAQTTAALASSTESPDRANPQTDVPAWQIGADGAFLPAPVNINDLQTPGAGQLLILAPGERADVVVDFANATQGSFYYLSNHATENSPLGNAGDRSLDQDPLVTLAMEAALRFEVKGGGKKARPLTSDRLTKEIKKLNPVANNPNLKPLRAAARPYDRAYVLTETAAAYQADDITWQRNAAKNPNFLSPAGRFGWKAITFEPDVRVNATGVGSLFGGQVLGGVAALTATQGVGDQASAMPRGGPGLDTQDTVPASQHQLNPGRVELWEIYNTTADVHPIHLHLTQFQVLERQTLDLTASTTDATAWPVAQVAAQSLFGPDANEMGWKDTVRVNPNQVTRLLVRFDDANDQCHTYSGNFVWHCHILEHEDMGMMRPLKIY